MDHALSALAWTRHDGLLCELVEWTNTRPALRRLLHIPPSDYARVAGFEIEAGLSRELTSPSCFRLRIGAQDATVSLFEPAGTCAPCGRPAVRLVKFDAGAPDAFSGLPPLVTCLDCAAADVSLVRVDGARIEWLGDACERAEGWDLAPARAALVARPAWEAVEWTCADGLSQVGGHPSWIVDLDYRPCPGCGRTMRFVAQVGLGDLGGEGVFYAQHCDDCAIVGVTYQQT